MPKAERAGARAPLRRIGLCPGDGCDARRRQTFFERRHVGIGPRQHRLDEIRHPAPEHSAAAADRVRREQGVIQAAQAQRDHQHDRQRQRESNVEHVPPRIERHEHATCAFDGDAIGASGEHLVRCADPREVDRDARLGCGEVRRDRGRECKRVAEAKRGLDVAGRRECRDILVACGARCDAGGDGLHSHRAPALRRPVAQQRARDDGLADARVGTGDEQPASHFPMRVISLSHLARERRAGSARPHARRRRNAARASTRGHRRPHRLRAGAHHGETPRAPRARGSSGRGQ